MTQEGDVIVNVGLVNTPPRRNGVFVEFEVATRVWSTFTGRQIDGVLAPVLHEQEQVWIVKED